MLQKWRAKVVDRIFQHRARWTARRLLPWLRRSDRVLDYGAGDCRLDRLLAKQAGCSVTPVDTCDTNQTDLPLTLYDGRRLPFADGSFDVVLLIFVLHHTVDPRAVLAEAARVCRRHVLVFEDMNATRWDRWMFRGFHRWAKWLKCVELPEHEWTPEQWSSLARDMGMREPWQGVLGRQLSVFASRHIGYVWEKAAA